MRWLNLVALGFKGNRQINQNIVEEIFLSLLAALKVIINKSTGQFTFEPTQSCNFQELKFMNQKHVCIQNTFLCVLLI